MKKIFRFSVIVSLFAALVSLTSCQNKELDVDPLGDSYSFNGMAPNPVMRGGAIRIFGRGLDKVSEVRFAGDVTVTEFIKVSKGSKLDTLELIVPLEGPVVGKVSIVNQSGKVLTSFSDLSFTEPIEIESFSPAAVLSGDVLTFKGEYLNVVKQVFFSGEDAYAVNFESQSRHELKVKVPANALSGPVILSDVNEIEDGNTIPNHIYTPTDLVVSKPTVVKAEKATYKSGDVITVTGEHLDMIKNVALPQVASVEFTVAEDAKSISFNLDPAATDGSIILTSFAGDEFDAGEIETVTVKELTVKSLAEDGRYKAGVDVEITGTDLDLVTKVEFTGAEASWYLDGDKIVATQPDAAKDGAVTVTLESGKKAYSEDIEVVKPVAIAWDSVEEVIAGQSVVKVIGTDLDLVVSVKMGTKEKGFIDCEYEFVPDDSGETDVEVSIPEQAYTAPIVFTSAAGYETETLDFAVTYDMAVSISFDTPEVGLGNNIVISGKNLMQIEQVFIKGKKVTSFGVRTDTSMSFGIPEKLGPGVYRLDLVLIDGTELTWPIPFSITAPFTETFIWEGSMAINWTGMGALSWGGYDWSTVEEGTVLCAHFTVDETADYWQIRFGNGSWASLPSLAGLAPDGNIPLEPGMTEYKFELTAADLNALVNEGGLVMTGANYTITGVSLIVFGAAEKRTTIWEGNQTVGDWDGSMGALSWGGYDWSTVEVGTKLAVSFTADADNAVMRFGNGSWVSLPSLAGLATDGNLPIAGLTSYEFELTAEDLDQLVNAGGLVICGAFWTLTEVSLVTVESAGPQPVTIWEGSQTVGDWDGSMGALSWGGYDWSTVEAGTILTAYFTADADNAVMRFGNGSWVSLPSLAGLAADGNLPIAGLTSYEFELTVDDLDQLVNAGGLVICGAFWTITEVTLK